MTQNTIYLDEVSAKSLLKILKQVIASEGSRRTNIFKSDEYWLLCAITEEIGEQVGG